MAEWIKATKIIVKAATKHLAKLSMNFSMKDTNNPLAASVRIVAYALGFNPSNPFDQSPEKLPELSVDSEIIPKSRPKK